MKKRILLLLAAVFLFLYPMSGQANQIVNGDFSSGLDGWDYSGGVNTTGNGELILTDNSAWYYDSTLVYDAFVAQEVYLASGKYLLEFDFFNNLSDNLTDGYWEEYFAVSLFGSSHEYIMDMYETLLMGWNEYYGGSAKSYPTGWYHYELYFNQDDDVTAMLEFYFFDLNGIIGDSMILLDNISITEISSVPEPSTFTMLGMGICCLAIVSRYRKSR